MKIRFGALLLGLGICLSGCGDKEEDGDKSYALVTTGVASFWDICKKGGEDAGAELGVQVEVLMPNGSTEQRKALEGSALKRSGWHGGGRDRPGKPGGYFR